MCPCDQKISKHHEAIRVVEGDCKLVQLKWIFARSTPHPVTVTTRIITFLVGNPYKPSFPLLLGGGTTLDIWVFPKIMLFPNHPFVHRGFGTMIFTIHFGGLNHPPLFLVGNIHIYGKKDHEKVSMETTPKGLVVVGLIIPRLPRHLFDSTSRVSPETLGLRGVYPGDKKYHLCSSKSGPKQGRGSFAVLLSDKAGGL